MKKSLLLLVAALSFVQLHAQNLLTNGSFEQYTACPNAASQATNCTGWGSPTGGSPDFFHTCNLTPLNYGVPANTLGTQTAAQGNGYIGVLAYLTSAPYREYASTSFTPLVVGNTYEMSISISLADNSKYATDGFGVFFYDTPPAFPSGADVIPVTPQVSYNNFGIIPDKTNWVRLTKTFVADSTYDNLVVGCFSSNSTINTTTLPTGSAYAYYYIDSIVLKRLTNIYVNYSNTQLCAGETITVPYTLTGPPAFFAANNVFTMQLSDAAGSFTSPVNIGSASTNIAGSVQGTIPAATPPGAGYRVRIISSNTSDTSDPNTQNITIKPLPVPVAGSNSPVCEGNTLNLTAAALAGSAYSWAGPVSVPAVQNPSLSNATPAHAGDYIVTATLNGCSAKDTVTVVINPLPAIPTAGSNSPVCEGDVLNLNASSTTPGVSYSWAGPVSVPALQNPSLPGVTMAHNGVYTVTTTLNGCNRQATTTVVIKPIPAIPVAGSNSPVCTGGILNLSANSITPGVSYDWTGPIGFSSTTQNPVIDPVKPANAGNYQVTATLNGCTSATGTTTVVVNTVAYLGAYASPNDTLCEGDLLTVVTVPTNGGTNPQFQWYKNGAAMPGETKLTYASTAVVTGDTFYCRMTGGSSCNTTVTLYSNKIGITIYPKTPAPTVAITPVPAQPLPGNPVTFTAAVTNGGQNPSYQWQRNGTDIPGATASSWSSPGLYPYEKISVTVSSSEYCPESKTAASNEITVAFPTSVTNLSGTQSLYLFPNPNKGRFTISGLEGDSTLIEIINALGQKVYSATHTHKDGNTEVTIPQIAAGIYIIKAGHRQLRLVVE